MLRRLHEDPIFAARAAPVLDFFRPRIAELHVVLDASIDAHGVATQDGVALAPSAFEQPREASVLAHELFHVWARAGLSAREAAALPATPALFAPPGASIEEIATDLCAAGLCAQIGAPFHPSYLAGELPADLLESRVRRAREALRRAVREMGNHLVTHRARQELRGLSTHELCALALADRARTLRWPAVLFRAVAPLAERISRCLDALHAPQLHRLLARHLHASQASDFRRSPLWEGDSPLEVPDRVLDARVRARDETVLDFLRHADQALAFVR